MEKIAGLKRQHVDIAAKYLSDEVAKGARGDDFLASDLMKYLDAEFTGAKL